MEHVIWYFLTLLAAVGASAYISVSSGRANAKRFIESLEGLESLCKCYADITGKLAPKIYRPGEKLYLLSFKTQPQDTAGEVYGNVAEKTENIKFWFYKEGDTKGTAKTMFLRYDDKVILAVDFYESLLDSPFVFEYYGERFDDYFSEGEINF